MFGEIINKLKSFLDYPHVEDIMDMPLNIQSYGMSEQLKTAENPLGAEALKGNTGEPLEELTVPLKVDLTYKYDNNLSHDRNLFLKIAPTFVDKKTYSVFKDMVKSLDDETFADNISLYTADFINSLAPNETILDNEFSKHVIGQILNHGEDIFVHELKGLTKEAYDELKTPPELPTVVGIDNITPDEFVSKSNTVGEDRLRLKAPISYDSFKEDYADLHHQQMLKHVTDLVGEVYGEHNTESYVFILGALRKKLNSFGTVKSTYMPYIDDFDNLVNTLKVVDEGMSGADRRIQFEQELGRALDIVNSSSSGKTGGSLSSEVGEILKFLKESADLLHETKLESLSDLSQTYPFLKINEPNLPDYFKVNHAWSKRKIMRELEFRSIEDIATEVYDSLDVGKIEKIRTLKKQKELDERQARQRRRKGRKQKPKQVEPEAFTKKELAEILNRVSTGEGKKQISDLRNDLEQVLYFKSTDDMVKIQRKYGEYDNIIDLIRSTLESRYRQTSAIKTGYYKGIDIRDMVKALSADIDKRLSVSANVRKPLNLQLNDIRILSDYIFSKHEGFTLPSKNRAVDLLYSLSTISSLGGMGVSLLASDSMAYALLMSRMTRGWGDGLKTFSKEFVNYFKNIRKPVKHNLGENARFRFENYRTMKTEERDTLYEYTRNVLEKLTHVSRYTKNIHEHLYFNILRQITEDITERGYSDVVTKMLGLSEEHVNYLKERAPIIESEGEKFYSLLGDNNSSYGEDIHHQIIDLVKTYVPVNSTSAEAYFSSNRHMQNSLGRFFMKTFFLFKGTNFEQFLNFTVEPLLEGNYGKAGRYFIDAFLISLAYNMVKDFTKLKVPSFENPDDVASYLWKVLLDSPAFGIFGQTLRSVLHGELSNLGGGSAFGVYTPVIRSGQSVVYTLQGKPGKAANNLITAVNSINPIRNVPFLGVLFDRVLTDGLRTAVYGNADRYFRALNRYAQEEGTKYLIEPGQLYQ